MFERFTSRSRRAIVLAQEEARLLNHNYIGTEHLLLGLLADPEGDAARTLESLDVTLDAARDEVRQIVGEGTEPPKGHIPFTPRAKKVLELSLREALTLGSQSIGSEHLLLGLVAEGEGVGVQVLERLGAAPAAVKARAIARSGAEPDPVVSEPGSWSRVSRIRVEGLGAIQDMLSSIDRRLSAIERHLGIASPAEEPEPHGEEPEERREEPGAHGEEPGARREEPGPHGEAAAAHGEEPGAHGEEPGAHGEAAAAHGEAPGAEREPPGEEPGEPPGDEPTAAG